MWQLKALFFYIEKAIDFTIYCYATVYYFPSFKCLTAVLSFRIIKNCAYKIYSNYLHAFRFVG